MWIVGGQITKKSASLGFLSFLLNLSFIQISNFKFPTYLGFQLLFIWFWIILLFIFIVFLILIFFSSPLSPLPPYKYHTPFFIFFTPKRWDKLPLPTSSYVYVYVIDNHLYGGFYILVMNNHLYGGFYIYVICCYY